MDVDTNNVPELTVETETVRRNSSTISDLVVHSPPEKSLEPVKDNAKLTAPSQGDTSEESSIKRVDSDSKFGFMETVSLERSMQESAPNSPSPSIFVGKPDITPVQMRSLSLTEKLSLDVGQVSFKARPHSAECDVNTLSKYFSNASLSHEKNDEGLNFFNTLAANPAAENIQHLSKPLKQEDNANQMELAQEVQEDTNIGSVNTKPSLLKFFTEDKSGNDRNGKAFFDKIAEEKECLPSGLEIKEPILNMPAEEPFLNSSALNSDIEKAWIPSEKTRQILVSLVTSNVPPVLDKNQITMPGVIVEKDMVDPVKTLLVECNSPFAQQRKTLTENDVSPDEDGLKKLMESGCYNAAINLTKRLLKSCGQGLGDDGKPSKHTPLSLRFWYVRLALFVKLQKFAYAEVEGAAFGNLEKPDLYYEFYPDMYKGKKGSMVPFSLRLLLAELPQYQGSHQIAVDNLYQVLHVIQKMITNVKNGCAEDGSMIELSESRRAASLEIWSKRERRVLYSILNCILIQKDYILAVSISKVLIEKSREDVPQLYSALGRIYLQLGDVKYAQDCFSKAIDCAQSLTQDFETEENINKALLEIAHNNNEEAYKHYEKAYLLSNNAMLANNMAVCLLYMGKLKESLTLLERTILDNPTSCLHDGLLFNICTLYELESSRCAQKKLAMLERVSQHVGDSFNVSCLKISPSLKA